MARGVNLVMLLGNLTKDPEIRTTTNGTSVCTISIATNRSRKNDNGGWDDVAEYHDVVLWDKQAELASQYLSKGRKVFISGRLQTRSWDDAEGNKRYKTEVVATEIQFLDKADSSNTNNDNTVSNESSKEEFVIQDLGDEAVNLDDIPF